MKPIIKKGDSVPCHAVPESNLNRRILEDFIPWISQLLSLKATNSNVERMEVIFAMFKEHAWYMSIEDVKMAFWKYANGDLPNLDPRDNYLTPILFGQVIKAYKQTLPVKPLPEYKPEISEDEKRNNEINNVLIAYDTWAQTEKVGHSFHTAFDTLYDMGVLPPAESDPKIEQAYQYKLHQAHLQCIAPLMDEMTALRKAGKKHTKRYQDIERQYAALNSSLNHPTIQSKFRCLVLEGFFKKTNRDELKQKLGVTD